MPGQVCHSGANKYALRNLCNIRLSCNDHNDMVYDICMYTADLVNLRNTNLETRPGFYAMLSGVSWAHGKVVYLTTVLNSEVVPICHVQVLL